MESEAYYTPADPKEERRMWCLERAVEAKTSVTGGDLINLAKAIEKYITGG